MIVDCRFFSDVWWGKAEAIYVTSYPRAVGNHKDAGWRFPKGATKGACGEVSHIYFHNIRCTSENGAFVGGDTPEKVDGEGFVRGNTYGFYIDTASDIRLQSCNVAWGTPRPDHAADNVKTVNTTGVKVMP